MADEAFQKSWSVDVGTLMASTAEKMLSRCCKADVKPLAPTTKATGLNFKLLFECTDCGDVIDITTGKTCRIPLQVQDSGDEADDDEDEDRDAMDRRKQKKRKLTNSRREVIVREVLACLLSGQT